MLLLSIIQRCCYNLVRLLTMKGDKMLHLSLIEFLLRTIPEAFMITYAIILLSNKIGIGIKKYLLYSLVLSVSTFLIRMFPISFGLHIIINIIVTISIMTIVGIPLIKSIHNTFFMYFILSISEFINIGILKSFNVNSYLDGANVIKRLLAGSPSLFITIIFILIIKFISKREERKMSIIENIAFKFGELVKKN